MQKLARLLIGLAIVSLPIFAVVPQAQACLDCFYIGAGYGEACGVADYGFDGCRMTGMYFVKCIPTGGACGPI